jgi:hypothetical protein
MVQSTDGHTAEARVPGTLDQRRIAFVTVGSTIAAPPPIPRAARGRQGRRPY